MASPNTVLVGSEINELYRALSVPFLDGFCRPDLVKHWYNEPDSYLRTKLGQDLNSVIMSGTLSDSRYILNKRYTDAWQYYLNNDRYLYQYVTAIYSPESSRYNISLAITYLTATYMNNQMQLISSVDSLVQSHSEAYLLRCILIPVKDIYRDPIKDCNPTSYGFKVNYGYVLNDASGQSSVITFAGDIFTHNQDGTLGYSEGQVDTYPFNRYSPAKVNSSYFNIFIDGVNYIPYCALPRPCIDDLKLMELF